MSLPLSPEQDITQVMCSVYEPRANPILLLITTNIPSQTVAMELRAKFPYSKVYSNPQPHGPADGIPEEGAGALTTGCATSDEEAKNTAARNEEKGCDGENIARRMSH